MMQPTGKREEEAIVLDFLQHGYTSDSRPMHLKSPIALALGTEKFTILELVPRKDVYLQPLTKVYIGEGKRDQIHHVNGRIDYDKLTETAKKELVHVVRSVVQEKEARFVDFYNKAQPLSIRTHSLELLPGIGKKHMNEILEARRDAPFTSFEDIRTRVKLISDPEKLVVNRVMNELEGKEKHFLFTVAPPQEDPFGARRPRR